MEYPMLTFTAHGEEHTVPAPLLARIGEYARQKAMEKSGDDAETPFGSIEDNEAFADNVCAWYRTLLIQEQGGGKVGFNAVEAAIRKAIPKALSEVSGPSAEGRIARMAREAGIEAPIRPDSENEVSSPRSDDDVGHALPDICPVMWAGHTHTHKCRMAPGHPHFHACECNSTLHLATGSASATRPTSEELNIALKVADPLFVAGWLSSQAHAVIQTLAAELERMWAASVSADGDASEERP